MRHSSIKISLGVFLGIVLVAAIAFVERAFSNRRSTPGHIVRYFQGEHGPQQTISDLCDDLRRTPQLQSWAVETLARFRAGQVKTNGISGDLPSFIPNLKLAREERPNFIRQFWGETDSWGDESPELLILLKPNGQPDCVALNWYDHGLAIGGPDYRLSFDPDLSSSPKPGIYAYHFYFK